MSIVCGLFVGVSAPPCIEQSAEGITIRVKAPDDFAVRRFRAGETLIYGFKLLEPTDIGIVRMRVTRDAAEVYTSEPLKFNPDELFKVTYVLNGSEQPGHYQLEIEVNGLRDRKNRRTWQGVPFEVVP